MRAFGALPCCFGLLLATLGAGSGCNSGSDPELPSGAESAGCLVNSDCTAPLVCAFERCHVECVTTRDCDGTLRCVGAEAAARVCQLEDEAACKSSEDCQLGFACAQDEQCRETCQGDGDCTPGQLCTAGACAEQRELDEQGRLPRVAAFASCGRDADCATGWRCVEQTCLAECRADRDCSSQETCVDGSCRGEAPACAEDADCPEAGQSCVEHECRCACRDDIDCGAGRICDGCACQPEPEPECRWDLECAVDQRCVNGACACECRENRDCAHGQACDGCTCQRDNGPTVIHDAIVRSTLDVNLLRGIVEVQETLTLSGGGLSSTVGLESLRRVKNLVLESLVLDYTAGEPLAGLAGLVEISGTLTIQSSNVQQLSFNPDLEIGAGLVLVFVGLNCADALAFKAKHLLSSTFNASYTLDCSGTCGPEPGTCKTE